MKSVTTIAILLVSGLGHPLVGAPTASSPQAGAPTISHEPLRCIQVAEFPQVAAGIVAPVRLKRTRVYFRAQPHPDWYFVEMRALGTAQHLALLPQPLPETKQVDYYVQALDERVQSAQTQTYEPRVGKGRCAIKVPAWKGREEITIGGTKAGQPPLPPGFSRKGIVAFLTASGSLLTGSALVGGGAASAGTAATGTGVMTAGAGSASASATAATGATTATTATVGSASAGAAAGGAATAGAGSASASAAATGATTATAGSASAGAAAGATASTGSAAAGVAAGTGTAAASGGSSALLIAGGGLAAAGIGVAALVATRGGDEPVRTPVIGISPEPYAVVQVTNLAFSLEGAGSRAASYSWAFGDGVTASGASATHIYTTEGTFTVMATASDGAGTATATVLVRSLTGTWIGTSENPGMTLEVTQEGTSVWGREALNGSASVTFTGTIQHPMSLNLTFRDYLSCPGLERAHTGEVREQLTFLAHYGMNCNWDGGWRFRRP